MQSDPFAGRGPRPATPANPASLSMTRRFALVVAPFVTGYFLSYYFRTVNAVLSERLMAEFGFDAVMLGAMTSAYFLMAAAVQLPFGAALDRIGPRRFQTGCLVIAAAGALLFAMAQDFVTLFVARALIGLGVASALMAGLKALAMCSAPSQLGLLNGIFISVGATGALAASFPTEALLQLLSWRELFLLLAAGSLISAVLILTVVPRALTSAPRQPGTPAPPGYLQIACDRAFWQLAPLSALGIGGAWALQGLWAASWLRDVAELKQADLAEALMLVAIALCIGGLTFGVVLHRLRRLGVPSQRVMAGAALAFILAEIGLALGWPVSPVALWCMIGAFGAGTVLSYTITAEHFPKECIARANSALNCLHFGAAFAVQCLFGVVLAMWPRAASGAYPPAAYQAALLGLATLQLLALLWFLRPTGARTPEAVHALSSLASPALAIAKGQERASRWLGNRLATLTVLALLGLIVAQYFDHVVALQIAELAKASGIKLYQFGFQGSNGPVDIIH